MNIAKRNDDDVKKNILYNQEITTKTTTKHLEYFLFSLFFTIRAYLQKIYKIKIKNRT